MKELRISRLQFLMGAGGAFGLLTLDGCRAFEGDGGAYGVAILGDTHYDAEPESVYHSHYDESNRWAKVQHAEFRRNGEMWRGRCKRLLEASGRLAAERPTDFVLQLGDLVQGDCDDVPTHGRMLTDCMHLFRKAYPAGLPFLTVLGNHDVRGKGARTAYLDFAEKTLSPEAGVPARYPAFSFRKGRDLWVFCDFETQDIDAIVAEMERNPDVRHTFLVTHGPFTVSEGNWPNWRLAGTVSPSARLKLYELLSRRHAVVLSGHTHTTAYFRHENAFGGFCEFTSNSVWKSPELATDKPICQGALAYGMHAAVCLSGKEKDRFDAAAKEIRAGLKDYYLSPGAGHYRLTVSETTVSMVFYPGDARTSARTFDLMSR